MKYRVIEERMEYLVNLNHKLVSSVSWLPESSGTVRRGSIPARLTLMIFKQLRRKCCLRFDIYKWLDPLVFLDKQ